MIYLDYAANTPVDEEVLKSYDEAAIKYIANPNSSHKLGKLAQDKIDECSKFIADYFKTDKENVIYTSGASESNNLVIKGVCERYKNIGNHIIISSLEHSSIVAPVNYLQQNGFDVSVIPVGNDGKINLEELKSSITDKTILVSICSVDSELGTIQPIQEIRNIISNYPNCIFHTDATQAIGKIDIDYTGVDFITFTAHKFFGLNGSGALINVSGKKIVPQIHGGKSTTIYRSGTPVISNIVSLTKAFELAINNLENRYNYNSNLNKLLRDKLSNYNIHINSPIDALPNILNISLIDKDNKEIVKKLEENDIYVSTTTACSLSNMPSKSVLAITNDEKLASNTIRISISHLTNEEDINKFIDIFNECML